MCYLQITDESQEKTTKEFGVNTEKPSIIDRETQTQFVCSDVLAGKIDIILNRHKAKKSEQTTSGEKCSHFSFEAISQDKKLFQFYTGLTVSQFEHLLNALGDTAENLTDWRGSRTKDPTTTRGKTAHKKVSTKNQLFMTLMKLKQAFPNIFSCPCGHTTEAPE